ncbi:P-loop containing nucleoside triphosphate hydrolase protein [Lasiosphaeria miniovina]|uniref:P-loop containing nucleoside triphosphate hydrolase protein n=1 Tax=Lasiosphaeria miniovina TaxID=1954250 RepID=A0AA40AM24_9PEZI|nr:P-loop containing nucleoside triphosphate hydrolase protein [Lasiosphaeria miniovina]KAK0718352.1 P-loop containing nucleoside triphosphate hydrolase protein [Lasiosphaeria miniovina]
MSSKPIFVATHPRACSTAFERVFMTRRDILHCVHEPFGDAFYYGPERLSSRFADDAEARKKSGFANTTYKTIMNSLQRDIANKRVFIKDIAHYLLPPNGQPATIAPSLLGPSSSEAVNGATATTKTTTADESKNSTVVPTDVLRQFHFTFLIRHPRRAIPSYYRCTVPPLDKVTGFYHFMPSEAGYDELRRLFDYLRDQGIIGPDVATSDGKPPAAPPSSDSDKVTVTVVDADDLLDQPENVIRAYCAQVGIDFSPAMLRWEDPDSHAEAKASFEKWNGFHDDAIGSTSLKPRAHAAKTPTAEEEDEQWRQKFGTNAQKVIRACVDANVPDYEYLKSFAMKF